MVKIKIIAVGKVKEEYFTSAINEYKKRLSRYCDFSIEEVPEENYNSVNDSIIEKIKAKEEGYLLPKMVGHVFATAIEGKKYTSQAFAEKLKGLMDQGKGVITFVIGGSYGMTDKVKKQADELISFSDMTFPHTFFRAMLTEQIYRAFTIIDRTPYHK